MKRILILFWLLPSVLVFGQQDNRRDYITVQMVPNHSDWVYSSGEDITITLRVVRHYYAMPEMEVQCAWGKELRESEKEWTVNTGKKGEVKLRLKGQKEPGFKTLTARVKFEGKQYTNRINIAIEPTKIVPTTQMPKDFDAFWSQAIEEVRRVPLKPKMTLQPDLCTADYDVYEVQFQNHKPGCYLYGMMSIPKHSAVSGQYSDRMPVVIEWPGAGVKPHRGIQGVLVEKGCIVLEMGVNGIPVNEPDAYYRRIKEDSLDAYWTMDNDDRDAYYYKKIYAGTVKTVDFLCTLDFVDTTRIAVTGGSQGGALSIIHAALDKRVKCASAAYPALCEIAGFYHGRVGGWPKVFNDPNEPNLVQKVAVSEYYDVVNFARKLTCPVKLYIGYNDQTCCPTSTYAAYNVITSRKELFTPLDCAHWQYPEHRINRYQFILSNF